MISPAGNQLEIVLMLLSVPLALAGGLALDSASNDDRAPEDEAPDVAEASDPAAEPLI